MPLEIEARKRRAKEKLAEAWDDLQRADETEESVGQSVADEDTREFIEINNPAALKEIAQRFEEAASRGLWTPRLNSAYDLLRDLQQ